MGLLKDIALLGGERALRVYPFRAYLDHGIPLGFGSDFPGERTFDPIYGTHLAVNRESPQAITAEEAVSCYTAGSAYLEYKEHEKGRLKKGYFADMAVLSADPTSVPASFIRGVVVESTIVNGQIVYTRAPSIASAAAPGARSA